MSRITAIIGLFPTWRMRITAVVGLILLLLAQVSEAADPWQGRVYDRLITEEWFDVQFGQGKIGFSTNTVEAGPDGYRLKGRAVIRLQVAGQTNDLSFSQTFHLDKNKRVIGFVSLQNSGAQRMETVGRMVGERLDLSVGSGQNKREFSRQLPADAQFLETIAFTMSEKFAVGFDKTFPVYVTSLRAIEPIRLQVVGKETINVAGKPVETWVTTTTLRGFVTRMWIAPDGRTVREQEPSIGIVTQLTTKEKALTFADKGIPITSLITYSLVKPDKPLSHPNRIKRLSLFIDGLETPRDIPRDERQQVGAPIWRDGADGKRKMTLPVTIVARSPEKISPLANLRDLYPELVAPTPELQADHPEIVALSRQLTKDALDAWGAALSINRWVNANIEKELVDSFTALDVLHLKKGECQAHTNLFAALARAAGIPTKVAGGLVYSGSAGGFLYHAWPEVFVGEWVAMDPTFGESIADATHLKLFDGGLEDQIKLISYVGRISIRIGEQ